MDENNNLKFAIYTYPKPMSPVRGVLSSSSITIDLNSSSTAFASLSKVANMTQRASFILRDSSWLEHQNCSYMQPNISYANFFVKLIDSTNGQVVCLHVYTAYIDMFLTLWNMNKTSANFLLKVQCYCVQ